jgi:hypothetical protein
MDLRQLHTLFHSSLAYSALPTCRTFQGAIHLHDSAGNIYMLALCEGNHCKQKATGRDKGNGKCNFAALTGSSSLLALIDTSDSDWKPQVDWIKSASCLMPCHDHHAARRCMRCLQVHARARSRLLPCICAVELTPPPIPCAKPAADHAPARAHSRRRSPAQAYWW